MVQTFPEPATRSDLMPNFVKGYLGKKYGVRVSNSRLVEEQSGQKGMGWEGVTFIEEDDKNRTKQNPPRCGRVVRGGNQDEGRGRRISRFMTKEGR